uniref:Transcription factor 25 n=1 Tax=Aceria tosichella TaxID=561515 RepID=A0A6G1SBG7_9ACAR
MSKKVDFAESNIEHEIEEDPELESPNEEKRQYNKFELLDLIEGDDDGASSDLNSNQDGDLSDLNEQKEEDDDDTGVKQSAHNDKTNGNNKSSANNRRKPRKKRGKGKGSKKSPEDDGLDDELANLARAITTSDVSNNIQSECSRFKLLKVDTRNLIPEIELKRIFGRGVIKDDKTRPKIHPGSNLQRSRFVSSSYFETKPSSPFVGPRMELDDTINNVRDNDLSNERRSKKDTLSTIFTDPDRPVYFKFVHDKSYQEAQRMFIEAVHRGHSEFIVQSLSAFPAHAESLVQLSHMVRVSEDYKTASEFIERALVVFERGFHPRFNIATATCRLSYKRPENRTFFITIFKHINCCHRRGLRRTPLEYCKLLLSLEPENDPLMAILLLDFFAIRCEDYDYLIEFYSKWDQFQKLPNLKFSLALAYFLKSRCSRQSKSENEANLKSADKLLKEALLVFPNFIIPLLDACSGEPDAALKQCSYFDYSVYGNKYKLVPETVEVLVDLYVKRTFSLWKQKLVLGWLERNVAELVADFTTGVLADEGKHLQHWSSFPKVAPKNLLRHMVLCDLDIKIPSSASSTTYIDIDPYPPTDSIITYDTTTLSANQSSSAGGSGSLFEEVSGLFLRSILPSFSLADPNQPNAASPTSSGQQANQTTARARPGQRSNTGPRGQASIRDMPEGGAVLRISGADREESHYLDREGAESLMAIIGGLQDIHGLQVAEILEEGEEGEAGTQNTDNNQEHGSAHDQQQNNTSSRGSGRGGVGNQNGLRRRHQPRRR